MVELLELDYGKMVHNDVPFWTTIFLGFMIEKARIDKIKQIVNLIDQYKLKRMSMIEVYALDEKLDFFEE